MKKNPAKSSDMANNPPPGLYHSSKEEIITILREENPPIDSDNRYSQLFLIIELKKISSTIGIIKGELYNNDQLDYRGSLLIPLTSGDPNQKSVWDPIDEGKSVFYGISFDTREGSITELISGFVFRSFSDGKIQDFLPFGSG